MLFEPVMDWIMQRKHAETLNVCTCPMEKQPKVNGKGFGGVKQEASIERRIKHGA